jgi:hypothetical protein
MDGKAAYEDFAGRMKAGKPVSAHSDSFNRNGMVNIFHLKKRTIEQANRHG